MNTRKSPKRVHYIPNLCPSGIEHKAPGNKTKILPKTRINLRNIERRFAPLNILRCCEFTLEIPDIFPDKPATNLECPTPQMLSPVTVVERRQLVGWQVRYFGSHGYDWIQERKSHH